MLLPNDSTKVVYLRGAVVAEFVVHADRQPRRDSLIAATVYASWTWNCRIDDRKKELQVTETYK